LVARVGATLGKTGSCHGTPTFSKFSKSDLAFLTARDTIHIVPPFDDFGDWATPKEPRRNIFFPLTSFNIHDPTLKKKRALPAHILRR
jgi:hypothetical protein